MKLEATTVQSHHIKQFFSSLKEQISDTDLDCSPTGIKILSMDATHNVCVHAELNASGFEQYICKEPFSIGVDVVAVNKILRHTVNGDILTIFIDENEDHTGDQLGIKIKNDQKAEDCIFFVDAIDTMVDKFRPEEDIDYPVSLSMPSSDLQSIIGRLKNTGSDTLQLIYKKDTLTFIAKGSTAKATINRHKPDNDGNHCGISIRKDTDDSFISVFLGISKVAEFTKCTNLSQFVIIYLRNDVPVFFEYQIGGLGKIRLGLSTKAVPDNW